MQQRTNYMYNVMVICFMCVSIYEASRKPQLCDIVAFDFFSGRCITSGFACCCTPCCTTNPRQLEVVECGLLSAEKMMEYRRAADTPVCTQEKKRREE